MSKEDTMQTALKVILGILLMMGSLTATQIDQLVFVSNSNVLANGQPSVNPVQHPRWAGIEDQFFPQAELIAASAYPHHPQIGGLTVFTFEFCVPGDIISGNVLVGSDNIHQVWLNGKYVGGSIDENNYQPGTEDNYNISSQLRSGDNFLKFLVGNLPQPGGDKYSNPEMLIFELLANFKPNDCYNCGTPNTPVPEPNPAFMFLFAGWSLYGIWMLRK